MHEIQPEPMFFDPNSLLKSSEAVFRQKVDAKLDLLSEEGLLEIDGKLIEDFGYASILVKSGEDKLFLDLTIEDKEELSVRVPISLAEGEDVRKKLEGILAYPRTYATSMGVHPQIIYYSQQQIT